MHESRGITSVVPWGAFHLLYHSSMGRPIGGVFSCVGTNQEQSNERTRCGGLVGLRVPFSPVILR